jgi:cyanobactin maturation PatA/PatG family protease
MPSLEDCFLNRGDPQVRVAVLDGQVDLEHPCFQGADIALLTSPISSGETNASSAHGTHVASVIFGQHGSEVEGLVPNCSGFVIPIFSDESRSVSQLDLARAIESAVEKGAHVVNISGGQLTDAGEADVWLHNAIRLCCDRNVLVIAAAGNDGCECLHVPAALPNVLAVGALDRRDRPMNFSNWGEAYRTGGVMAPGEDILGAKPGGGTTRASGTSFATPLVSGAAAFLLSQQASWGLTPDPLKIRRLLLDTALPCAGSDSQNPSHCLAGKLNLPGAFDALTGSRAMTYQSTTNEAGVTPQCACEDANQLQEQAKGVTTAETARQTTEPPKEMAISPAGPMATEWPALGGQLPRPVVRQNGGSGAEAANPMRGARLSAITPSQSPDEVSKAAGMVYALGVLGYDFGTEARRDTFKQLMPAIDRATGQPVYDPVPPTGTTYPANPYDARQMVDYLIYSPSEARSLIWTLNIDLTSVYAIEPAGPYGAEVYEELRTLLGDEIRAETDPEYVERISIPGLLNGRTVKLFSGQVVPVIEPQGRRGIYGWETNKLIAAALAKIPAVGAGPDDSDQSINDGLRDILNRIYYDLRNLGKTSEERALNYAATNAFVALEQLAQQLVLKYQLDEITVVKSPFCRPDSDCWDVRWKFFDPANNQKAKRIIRFTVDVSDLIPVVMGEPRTWTQAN